METAMKMESDVAHRNRNSETSASLLTKHSWNFEKKMYYGSVGVLVSTMFITNFIALPVLLQMCFYTFPIIYIGSHMSLKLSEIDHQTGEKVNPSETMNHTDAMLFPVCGSAALLLLYVAYKFLDPAWVNFLLTLYLTVIGLVALAETLHVIISPLCNNFINDKSRFSATINIPFLNYFLSNDGEQDQKEKKKEHDNKKEASEENDKKETSDENDIKKKTSEENDTKVETPEENEKSDAQKLGKKQSTPFVVNISYLQICCYVIACVLALGWLYKKCWVLHNLLAIAFCIQAIGIVSVGNFTVATILLAGLFFYDIFWVFGTEVMVTVAKSFEGPAKLIFPVSLNPWQQSILGLGDIVIPGIFISMCLRFDHWLENPHIRLLIDKRKKMGSKRSSESKEKKESDFDIHQKFGKFYFVVVMIFYELGLLTTGIVMLVFQHPQPALLYLVPYCLLSFFGASALNGQVKEALAYQEDDSAKEQNEQPTSGEGVVETKKEQ